jgi:hypothetical protein
MTHTPPQSKCKSALERIEGFAQWKGFVRENFPWLEIKGSSMSSFDAGVQSHRLGSSVLATIRSADTERSTLSSLSRSGAGPSATRMLASTARINSGHVIVIQLEVDRAGDAGRLGAPKRKVSLRDRGQQQGHARWPAGRKMVKQVRGVPDVRHQLVMAPAPWCRVRVWVVNTGQRDPVGLTARHILQGLQHSAVGMNVAYGRSPMRCTSEWVAMWGGVLGIAVDLKRVGRGLVPVNTGSL